MRSQPDTNPKTVFPLTPRETRIHDRAIHLVGLELCVVGAMTASIAFAAVPEQTAPRHAGDVSGEGFTRLTDRMDPAMLWLASRFEPRADSLIDQTGLRGAGPTAEAVAASQEDSVIRLQALTPDAARLYNASVPAAELPNASAKPFKLNAGAVLDESRATDCLTAAVYYEAASESLDGQRAVAQVVLNRMRHPAYPKTVCGVVFQGSNRTTGCQFSFTCDGSLGRQPSAGGWSRARQVAVEALNGYVMRKVGTATHYHANYVAPYWSPSLVKIGAIGAHIFYRWTGRSGLPPAFSGGYAGGEMAGLQIATLDGLAKSQVKLDMSDAPESMAAPAESVVLAANSTTQRNASGQGAASPLDDAETLAAIDMGQDAGAITKPEELDWAGRPKPKGPPRVAVPGGL
ncbi:cell wall hydrolase [Phenylobacterium sp.]|uniref:cell wall hydrolase n=1 Tax=Phenylobacterium sp. TaxID=1871053 RepID=UPI002733AC42|nr:cell wall hydrolase [Phenylobacterium sp.]MDP3660663.1 cell wall hydrolase [Phenylobacterium sp.]